MRKNAFYAKNALFIRETKPFLTKWYLKWTKKRKIDKCAAQFLKQAVSVLGHQKRLWGSPLVLLGSGMIKLIKRQKNENLPICDLNRKAPYNLHKKTTDQRNRSVAKDYF